MRRRRALHGDVHQDESQTCPALTLGAPAPSGALSWAAEPLMYAPAQTNNADWRAVRDCRFVTSYGHDFGRVTIMKHTLLREINQAMSLRHSLNSHDVDAVHQPPRIQGGNGLMQGFRRSGPVYDELSARCQL